MDTVSFWLSEFGDTKFNKWANSKEYKLALAELESWSSDDSDIDHMANAIKHLEKELKQHPQNAYAEYYLAFCKGRLAYDNENETETLIKEQLQ